ncbi:uncharacterized protein LOC135819809 isoform X2 [Sycon ciliatum]|uniref:uncharacterized protein LOC135819809 isoform X2 n=1 Tax=Sycon ciliatum TaxID=27933 RepID=UPI0031F610C8
MSWESPVFIRLLPEMIRTFTAETLRTECESRQLITNNQKIKFEAYTGSAKQNEALLDAVRTGDDESFHDFLECIRNAHVMASVRKILEKLDPIDKYRKPAESATPVSKTTDPGKQDQATGSFPAGAGVAAGAAAAASDNWPQGQKLLSEVHDWEEFSRSLEGCVSRVNREGFAKAVAVLIDPDNANGFKDTIQDFIARNGHGSTDLQNNLYGVIRWAVDKRTIHEVTLAELEKIALRLNPDKKKSIHKTFRNSGLV